MRGDGGGDIINIIDQAVCGLAGSGATHLLVSLVVVSGLLVSQWSAARS